MTMKMTKPMTLSAPPTQTYSLSRRLGLTEVNSG